MYPVPKCIAAGSTLLFTETLNGFPATAYALTFILSVNGVPLSGITAIPSGSDFVVSAPASTTSTWAPGRYIWAQRVTANSDSTITSAGSGSLSVTPDFSQTITVPSQAKLVAVEATILKALANPNSSVNFNSQSFTSRNLKDLFDIRDRIQAQVDAERRIAGISNDGGSKRIVTQFRNE